MKVKKLCLLIACFMLIAYCSKCFAQASTGLDLINNAKEYDNKTVNYKGEIIGDVMVRGDHAWLHVNDGSVAIGIWAPKALIEDIRYAGDYHKTGDTVEVSGIFHRSCLEHGGDLDIHASEIRIVFAGCPIVQPFSEKKFYVGIASAILVLLFYLLKKCF